MEANRDEQIVCAECGETFPFSAAEASFYAQKNLAAPPKRCKPCRAARKERAGQSDTHGAQRGPQRPKYTGDVNEYRSPMQDRGNVVAGPMANWAPRRPRPGGAVEGNHRAPAFASPSARMDRAQPRPADRSPRRAEARTEEVAVRPRSHGAMFDITCSTCGAATQVPFKPIEGREVFCQPCYRARKPQAAD